MPKPVANWSTLRKVHTVECATAFLVLSNLKWHGLRLPSPRGGILGVRVQAYWELNAAHLPVPTVEKTLNWGQPSIVLLVHFVWLINTRRNLKCGVGFPQDGLSPNILHLNLEFPKKFYHRLLSPMTKALHPREECKLRKFPS